MKAFLRKIVESYFLALAFALWGAVCAIAGATFAYITLIGVLNARGVL
jgi:hypothetical protein